MSAKGRVVFVLVVVLGILRVPLVEYRWLFVSPAISQANRSDRQPVMD
jgi:hypothetical protein